MSDAGAGRRRLAAVWFADVVGYTRLSAEDEDAALRVVGVLQRVATEATETRGGRVVKFIGDAVMTVFDSVDSALGAALATVAAFEASEVVGTHDVAIRVGLHLGEVVESADGDVYGDGVNVASRVEGAAAPGRVTVTPAVAQLIRNRPTYAVTALEARTLKGIAEPVVLHEVSLAGAGGARPGRPSRGAARSRRPGRAVGAGTGAAVVTFLVLSVLVAQKAPDLGEWGGGVAPSAASDAGTAADADTLRAGTSGTERDPTAPDPTEGGERDPATADPTRRAEAVPPTGPAAAGNAATTRDGFEGGTAAAEGGPVPETGPGGAPRSAAAPARAGAWRVDAGRDPLTDAPFVTLVLPSSQRSADLVVRCRDRRLAVELDWAERLADGGIRVREGDGRDRDARSQWTLLPDSSGLAYRGDPRRLLRELEGVGTWVAAVTVGRARSVAVFEPAGLAGVTERLQAADCR